MSSLSHDITKKAKSSLGWLASTSLIRQLISWGLTLVTARLLDPTAYGIAALPGTFLPYLTLLATFRLGTWLVQEQLCDEDKTKTVFTLSLMLSSFATALSLALSPSIANFYGQPELTLMFQVCSFVFIVQGLQLVPDALLRREMQFRFLSLVDLFVAVGQGVLTVTLALLGAGYWALVCGVLFGQVGRTAAIVYVHGVPKGLNWNKEIVQKSLRFGVAAAGASALLIVFSTADNVVVGKLFGAEMLGFYTMSYLFSQQPVAKIQMVVGPLLVPLYSKVRSEPEHFKQVYIQTSRAILALAGPVLVGAAITAPEGIPVLIGSHWIPMIPAFRVLCVVSLLQCMTSTTPSLYDSLGQARQVFNFNLLSVVVLVPAFCVGGVLFGMLGVCYGWFVGYAVIAAVILRTVVATLQITFAELFAGFRAPLVGLFLMTGCVLAIHFFLFQSQPPWMLLGAEVLIGGVVYAGVMWFVFRKDTLEMMFHQSGS